MSDEFMIRRNIAESDKVKLNMVIDFGKKNRDGSPKNDHLLKISNKMDQWDGTVAEALELGDATVGAIQADNANFDNQKYVVCLECA